MTYYSGVRAEVLSALMSNGELTGDPFVFITTSIPDAALFALSYKGMVAVVRPVGKVRQDKQGEKGIHYVCKRIKLVRIMPWREVQPYLESITAVEENDKQTQAQEVAVRNEEEVS